LSFSTFAPDGAGGGVASVAVVLVDALGETLAGAALVDAARTRPGLAQSRTASAPTGTRLRTENGREVFMGRVVVEKLETESESRLQDRCEAD
jgi:hypothetical protein